MNCNAILVFQLMNDRRKVAFTIQPDTDKETVERIIQTMTERKKGTFESKDKFGNHFRCGGKIKSKVDVEQEPYMGGSYFRLSVEFKCDTCGHSNYPNLPDEESINEWIEEKITEMKG